MDTLPMSSSGTLSFDSPVAVPASWVTRGRSPVQTDRALETRPAAQRPGPDEVVYKIASGPEELKAAFRLVYQSYLRCGLTKPNPYRMRVTPFHLLSTTEVFVAVHRGEVICTMTLVRDGRLGLPMEVVYGQEVACRRAQGTSVAEVSCLACRPRSLVPGLPVLIQVMSLMGQCARRRGIDELLIAIHPRHAAFYQRFIGFKAIGREKVYGSVCNKPAVALALDLKHLAVIHPRAHKRFFGSPFPEEELQWRLMSEELQAELGAMVDPNCVAEPCSAELELLAAG